ncbi:hypothetical protein LOKO_00543 [Halomonas chromatireducens]|uniref:Uncharacterized protein n=1 Tax=Halomonas chromatireducens TaxID=507626 RepID=A0A0X8HBL0_9GAMM|nr:hypothetical protein LOKO_00543 [Halomonas chromatireducens]
MHSSGLSGCETTHPHYSRITINYRQAWQKLELVRQLTFRQDSLTFESPAWTSTRLRPWCLAR